MRFAVFVDAGYLYAQGSTALAGHKLVRTDVELNLSEIVTKLLKASAAKTGNAPLLRIYWYDGLRRGELSSDQKKLANADDIKLRLGIVNRAGRQKGVDSLIVTDLDDLARNRAITDAVLLSGDEDLRIGVQIAQSFGVRVHLIGIEPSRDSQSLSLLQEADTTIEWCKVDICTFMALKSGFEDRAQAFGDSGPTEVADDLAVALEQVISDFVSSLGQADLDSVASLGEAESIPRDFDGPLLAMCGKRMERKLNAAERRQMRKQFRGKVRERAEGPQIS